MSQLYGTDLFVTFLGGGDGTYVQMFQFVLHVLMVGLCFSYEVVMSCYKKGFE